MNKLLFIVIITTLIAREGVCQNTLFGLLKKDVDQAMTYMEAKDYAAALPLLSDATKKNPQDKRLQLNLARCYYALKDYDGSLQAYQRVSGSNEGFSFEDNIAVAEIFASKQNYSKAIACYRLCIKAKPNNSYLMKKIWQLDHIDNLLEDSAHFSIKPLSFNSESGEFGAMFLGDGIAFVSNRKESKMVDRINASTGTPFYGVYYSDIIEDTIAGIIYNKYVSPELLSGNINSAWHTGPISFYNNGTKAVCVSSGSGNSNNGVRTLQLIFAEKKNRNWKATSSYQYNSRDYSISDVTISQDGTLMFFTSNMNGGFGGKDIYKSEYIDGRWTPPVNAGEVINTPFDEAFPYLHDKVTFYFSSNGHPGMGGLDIFKAVIRPSGFDEPQNLGFPINSSWDDFGIVIDPEDTHGYFSSNRKNGGYDDDLYELNMDLQAYPVIISGVIKFKEQTWSSSSELKLMPHARIELVDKLRNNAVVHESTTDTQGNFSIVVPYFSKYIIRVTSLEGEENVAILEIPKHKQEAGTHEIVLIKGF